MLNEIIVDQTVDCRGLSCPMPMLKVKKALAGLNPGEVLEMLGTDPGTANDIGTGAKKNNAEFLGSKEADGYTCFFLRKL